MKSDFNNPVMYVSFNGEDFQAVFGGPKPNGFINSLTVSLKLGGVGEFDINCVMPFNDGLDLLEKFITGSQKLDFTTDKIAVKIGYLPNYQTPMIIGLITSFPEFVFDNQCTISFRCTSLASVLYNDSVPLTLENASYLDVLRKLCRDNNIVLKTYESLSMMTNDFRNANDSNGLKMYMTSGVESKLDLFKFEYISKNGNSWNLIKEIFDKCGIVFTVSGTSVFAFTIFESSDNVPVLTFKWNCNFDVSKRIIPIDSIEMNLLPTTFIAANTVVRDTGFDATVAGFGTVINKNDMNSVTKAGANVSVDAEVEKKKDMVTMSGEGGVDQAKLLSESVTSGNKVASLSCTINSIGVPDVLPGDSVVVDLGREKLMWTYRVMEVKHNWDGKYRSTFELTYCGNVSDGVNKNKAKTTDTITIGGDIG